MPAGKLRDRITFQAASQVADGGGGFETAWLDQFTVWGQLMVGSVRERLEAGRLEASATAILRIRWSNQALQIKADWRAVIRGQTYNIRQLPEDPTRKRQWVDIQIETGVAS